MAREWYRQPDWDEDARGDFEIRLARAAARNRSQYMKIKAIALREAGLSDEARSLLERLLREYPDSFDAAYAVELLGDLARSAGAMGEAEVRYRQVIAMRPDLNTTSGEVHISLAEVLNETARYDDALKALNTRPLASLTLNSSRFRWNAALARAASGVGEVDVAKGAAHRALDLFAAPDQFSRHPGVGRPSADSAQIDAVRRLADGRPAKESPRNRRRFWRA